jgi:lipopolysaccharide/colanic/teichoic acid biosynthesis glycosyltransferase
MSRRALDLTISLIGSVISAPVVVLLALAIRLESPGDPIYRQQRVGRGGELFEIYKLRTMVSGAEFKGAGLAISAGDSRITRIGALLRRYSLDELPNLWNVLRGEMSIVDLWYVEHRSLALDCKILTRTLGQVLSGSGIYKGAGGGWQPPNQT